jgi:ectoine hydroxylase-related dioxygenase (phytanoyl-CoA dioxygenase family)
MSYETSLPIEQNAVDSFSQDGAICVRNVFTEHEVEALREAVDWSMNNPGDYSKNFSGDDAKASFFGDVFVWTRNPAYRDLVVNERLGEIAGRLMKADSTRFFFDHLLVKEPGSNAPTPWHQDAPYFPINGKMCCSIWIALDPVTSESGAVEYIAGSHATGKYYAPEAFTPGDTSVGNDQLAEVPDIDADRDAFDIVRWDLNPGDVAIHNVMTIHGAPANKTKGTRRRGLALRFIGDDITYAERPGIPEPMLGSLSQLAPELAIGTPYQGAWFPELWQAEK